MKVSSKSFFNGSKIPLKHACFQIGGENISPQVEWTPVQNAKSYILIFQDVDNPFGEINHWVLAFIPSYLTSIPETQTFESYNLPFHGHMVIQGKNSWNQYGFNGVCSPLGEARRYVIRVVALNKSFEECSRCTYEELVFKTRNHVIEYGEMWGWFLKEKPKIKEEEKYKITKNTPQDIPITIRLKQKKPFSF
ncbi:MAG: YbhB/YbcL family Raf kinase inhibitor-like protein [Magnetococcales bacterium]|nr:YbhB/YbcL family Raf kinase inhibitor-like protein [Magnetococcales bacterium]|tara:strand:+ start:57016 stop:57594 length:579 start_codon:yes stop_codon:yes gene_type:complete